MKGWCQNSSKSHGYRKLIMKQHTVVIYRFFSRTLFWLYQEKNRIRHTQQKMKISHARRSKFCFSFLDVITISVSEKKSHNLWWQAIIELPLNVKHFYAWKCNRTITFVTVLSDLSFFSALCSLAEIYTIYIN